jgi:hypothetical protein
VTDDAIDQRIARTLAAWERMGAPNYEAEIDDTDMEFFAPLRCRGNDLEWTDEEVERFAAGVHMRRQMIAERAAPVTELVPSWETVQEMFERENGSRGARG